MARTIGNSWGQHGRLDKIFNAFDAPLSSLPMDLVGPQDSWDFDLCNGTDYLGEYCNLVKLKSRYNGLG